MIPHNTTLLKFICVLYQFHRQTLTIMKIDRGQIQFGEYVFTGTEPKVDRKQDLNVLYQVVFFGRIGKQDDRLGLWLAETFSTSLKPLHRIKRKFTGSKISTSSTKFVFFRLIGKTRWPPWPLISLDILDFSSETAAQNSTKFDWKQYLNILCQVFVFSGWSE